MLIGGAKIKYFHINKYQTLYVSIKITIFILISILRNCRGADVTQRKISFNRHINFFIAKKKKKNVYTICFPFLLLFRFLTYTNVFRLTVVE